MSLVKFVHAADLHLDSPFKQIRGEAPGHVAERLYEATFDAWTNIVDLCVAERVDALLVAGDVYDGADRSLRAQRAFIAGLERLDGAGIRSFVCHGNHDPLDGWEAKLDYPPRCHRFGTAWESVPVFRDDPERAVVTGISYPTREVRENLVAELQAETGRFQIGLLHANVGGNADHDSYAPCSVDDLSRTGIDYWALGHVHAREVLRDAAPTVIYPGNPQGRHPNERGARGVYIVEAGEDRSVAHQFWITDVVRWEQIDLDISELRSEQDLLDQLPRRVDELLQAADGRPLVFRVDLHGRGPLHAPLRRRGLVGDLRDQVNAAFESLNPFAWCERITDRTAPEIDRDARSEGADFTAELLRLSSAAQADPEQLAEIAPELYQLYGNQRFRFMDEGAPKGEDLAALLQEAEAIALDLLVEDEA